MFASKWYYLLKSAWTNNELAQLSRGESTEIIEKFHKKSSKFNVLMFRCSSSPSLFLHFFKRFGVLFHFGRSSSSSSSSKFASSSTVASAMFLRSYSFSLSSTLSELEDKDYLMNNNDIADSSLLYLTTRWLPLSTSPRSATWPSLLPSIQRSLKKRIAFWKKPWSRIIFPRWWLAPLHWWPKVL